MIHYLARGRTILTNTPTQALFISKRTEFSTRRQAMADVVLAIKPDGDLLWYRYTWGERGPGEFE
jgi:hypothetical protein